MLENKSIILVLLLAFVVISIRGQDKPCKQRKYDHSSTVCVCNANYCDEVSGVTPLPSGSYVMYSSSQGGDRFKKFFGTSGGTLDWISENVPFAGKVTIKINRHRTFQTIIGFGGSFSDSAGINIESLSEGARENFFKSYFGEKGLEFNLGRVPIGGSDFSTHPYAYNQQPENDVTLSNFSLTEEDYKLKIPFIRRAAQVATSELLLVGSAWSPPVWMKTNRAFGGFSALLDEYYQTWADYHLKFLQEYKKNGVDFWAITTGNEPISGIISVLPFNSLGWWPPNQGRWVARNLGPTIKNSEFSHINIIALDDQRFHLPFWIEWMVVTDKNVRKYIDGFAVHWYWDDLFSPSLLDRTHAIFPDKYLIASEASEGWRPWEAERVQLGSWHRAETYVSAIMEDLNHWFSGWIDWNLALDKQGGPNWFNNFIDAAVLVVQEKDEFLKQPMFYAMGHFSKFLPRGSRRVYSQTLSGLLDHVAFLRPDKGITVIFYNPNIFDQVLTIRERGRRSITVNVPARSIHSLIYW